MNDYNQLLYNIIVGDSLLKQTIFFYYLKHCNYIYLKALIQMRRYIRNTRDIDYSQIQNNCRGTTIMECKEELEKLFLHPISSNMNLDEKMKRQDWTIKTIIEAHPKYPTLSLIELLNRPYKA